MLSLKFADLVGMTTHVRVSLLLLKRLLLKCQRWQREGCSVHAQRSERVCLDDALAAVSPIERLLPLLSVCLSTAIWRDTKAHRPEPDKEQKRLKATFGRGLTPHPLRCRCVVRCTSGAAVQQVRAGVLVARRQPQHSIWLMGFCF